MKNILIFIAIILAGGLIFIVGSAGKKTDTTKNPTGGANMETIQIVDGKQIIEVTARGGYNPRDIVAKAGVPTILRMKTSGTFDCSAAFVVPSLGIQKMLPQTGVTDFEIPAQTSGSNINGTCGMGMYRLSIRFE